MWQGSRKFIALLCKKFLGISLDPHFDLNEQGSISSTFYVQLLLVDPESVKITVKSSVSFYAFGIYRCKSCLMNVDEIDTRFLTLFIDIVRSMLDVPTLRIAAERNNKNDSSSLNLKVFHFILQNEQRQGTSYLQPSLIKAGLF